MVDGCRRGKAKPLMSISSATGLSMVRRSTAGAPSLSFSNTPCVNSSSKAYQSTSPLVLARSLRNFARSCRALRLEKLKSALEAEKMASTISFDEKELPLVKQLNLLTMKRFLYILNKKSGAQNLDELNDARWEALMHFMEQTKSEYVLVDAGIENELKDLSEDDKMEFRREYATLDSGIDSLIRGAYKTLGLMSYFTTGEKETRAWTIPVGSTAPRAGAAIHTDFEHRFIRAQVVTFEDLVRTGSFSKAREEGKLRTEGKEYIVQEGDVIEFMVG